MWVGKTRRGLTSDVCLVLQNQPMTMVGESEELTDGLRTQVLFAREYLKDVTIGEKQVERLVQEAARGGCQGHRAELFAARVAKASAALDVRALPVQMNAGTLCLSAGAGWSPCLQLWVLRQGNSVQRGLKEVRRVQNTDLLCSTCACRRCWAGWIAFMHHESLQYRDSST